MSSGLETLSVTSSSTPRRAVLKCSRCQKALDCSALAVELLPKGLLRIVLDCRCGLRTVLRFRPELAELRVLDGSADQPAKFSARPFS